MYIPIRKEEEEIARKVGYTTLEINEKWVETSNFYYIPHHCFYHKKDNKESIKIGTCYITMSGNTFLVEDVSTEPELLRTVGKSIEVMLLRLFIERLKIQAGIHKTTRISITSIHPALPEILVDMGFEIRRAKNDTGKIKGSIILENRNVQRAS